MNKEGIISELKTAVQVVLFNKTAMSHVAADKSKTKFGLYIIIVGALLTLVSQLIFMGGFITLIGGLKSALIQVVMTIISIYVLSLIAQKVFKGKGKHDEFFRVVAYASVLGWIGALTPLVFGLFGLLGGATIVMLLGLTMGIWGIILLVKILAFVHKLSGGRIAGTIIVMLILVAIVSKIFGYNSMYSTRVSGSYNLGGFGDSGGNLEILDENNFEMNIPGADGGSFKMEDGNVTITGPDGKVMEINVPQ